MAAGIKRVIETELKGVKIIKLSPYNDHRGSYIQTYNDKEYFENDIDVDFVESASIIMNKHSLRGIHGDARTWKLVSCLKGEIFEVVINCDEKSNDYGNFICYELSEKDPTQILIPPKFGHAFLALTDKAIFYYEQSHHRDKLNWPQFEFRWNSPSLNIQWPISSPIISKRDSESPLFPQRNSK